jgi:hypothetical protein
MSCLGRSKEMAFTQSMAEKLPRINMGPAYAPAESRAYGRGAVRRP